jgi:ABC-type multidrug transport system permease subunit
MGYGSRGAQERAGFLAFTLTFLLTSSIEALPMFLEERLILARETSRGAYRVSSYVLANTIVFLPFLFLLATLYVVPSYWLVGLAPNYRAFLFFLLVIWILLITANSFVAFFSSMVSDFIMGNSLVTGFMGAFFLFSGYFISKEYMPKYWLGLHYTSLFKYPLDALLINEYTSVGHDKCFGPIYADRCLLSGEDILAASGLTGENKWVNVVIMVSFAIIYRLLSYGVLCFKLLRRRQ